MAAASAAAREVDMAAAAEPQSARAFAEDDDELASPRGPADLFFGDDEELEEGDMGGEPGDGHERSVFHFGEASHRASPKSLRRAGMNLAADENDSEDEDGLAPNVKAEEEKASMERFRTLERTASAMADFKMGRERSDDEDEDGSDEEQFADMIRVNYNTFQKEAALEAARVQAEAEEEERHVAHVLREAADEEAKDNNAIAGAHVFGALAGAMDRRGAQAPSGGANGEADADDGDAPWASNPLFAQQLGEDELEGAVGAGVEGAPRLDLAAAGDDDLEFAENQLGTPRMIARPLPARASAASKVQRKASRDADDALVANKGFGHGHSKSLAFPPGSGHGISGGEEERKGGGDGEEEADLNIRLTIQDDSGRPILGHIPEHQPGSPSSVSAFKVNSNASSHAPTLRESRVFSYHVDTSDAAAHSAGSGSGTEGLASPSAVLVSPSAAALASPSAADASAAAAAASPRGGQRVKMHLADVVTGGVLASGQTFTALDFSARGSDDEASSPQSQGGWGAPASGSGSSDGIGAGSVVIDIPPLQRNHSEPLAGEPAGAPNGGASAAAAAGSSAGSHPHHLKQSASLQLPGEGQRGSPSSTGNSRRASPLQIHRPSITSLHPSTVHNRGPSSSFAAGSVPALEVPLRQSVQAHPHHSRRVSHASAVELRDAGEEHRAELEQLLTVNEYRVETTFPYSLEPRVGKDAYELLGALTPVGLSKKVATFVEPGLGTTSAIKGEIPRTVPLSDIVVDRSEAPSRFTRPYRRREFSAAATLKGLSALMAEVHHPRPHDHIECLVLFNERLRPLQQEQADLIQALPNLQTLQLQQIKVKSWSRPLKLPRLLNLDARKCGIKDLARVQQIVLNSPHLYTLTLSDNPLCDKFVDATTRAPTLPPVDHPIWKNLLLRLPALEFFNLIPIDNATRQRAWAHVRSKKLYSSVCHTLWSAAVNASPTVVALAAGGVGWRRDAVLELDLRGASLMTMHLHPFRYALQHLNVSDNFLQTLVGSGLHLCTALRSLNLSNNRLSNSDELYMLASLPLLRQLWLAGNPRLCADGTYTSVAVYATRHLLGTNRAPGLQELDGQAITLEQRVAAYALHAPKHAKEQAAAERWRLHLIQTLGHTQLVSIPHLFVTLSLASRPLLEFADVSALSGLVSLDLSRNRLKQISGLEKLTRLRILDVRFNPELNHKLLVTQVQAVGATVEWVSLSHSEEEMLDFGGLRARFLFALLPHCPKLAVLDHRRILPAEYARALKKIKDVGDESKLLRDYKLHLAMSMGNTPLQGRRYDIDGVDPGLPGCPYTLAQVRTLDLSGCKFSDSLGSLLPSLPSLTLLNLSSNKLTSLAPLALQRFPELLYLDLRHNKLKATPLEVAAAIAELPHLHAFAMAGNPSYNVKFRLKLITCIPEFASLDCELKIIDTFVTVDERVAAWGNAVHLMESEPEGTGGETDTTGPDDTASTDGVAAGSAAAAGSGGTTTGGEGTIAAPLSHSAAVRARRAERTQQMRQDNKSIKLLAQQTLRKEAEAAITAASETSSVRRRSRGSSSSSLLPAMARRKQSEQLALPSPNARLLALHGNSRRVVGGSNLLSPLAPKSKKQQEALRAAEQQLEKNIFRFHLVLQEHCPPGVESGRVSELPLVNLGLTWVDFHPFTSLTKLIISRNHLTSLAHCGLESLKALQVLDAHHNKLWDLGEVLGICNELPQLVVINFFKNPFVVFDAGQAALVEKTSAAMGLEAVSERGDADGSGARSSPSFRAQTPLSPSGARDSPPTQQMASLRRGSPMPEEDKKRRASLVGNNAAMYTPEKYRLTFIGHLQQLQSPARCLKFFDHRYVSEDEIIFGLKELGHSAADREMFRFNSVVFGKNGADPACQTLSLANRKLQRGDFTRFPHLTQLDLSRNLYTDETLLSSHLPQLSKLVELNLMENQIKSMRLLAAMMQAMPALRRLRVTGNPGYPKGDNDKSRRALLAYFTNVHMTSFRLDFLNSLQISIEERIDAMIHAKINWIQMHPPHLADRMSNVHALLTKDVLSPTHKFAEEEEKKHAQHPSTPPPNVGNGANPSPSAKPRSSSMMLRELAASAGSEQAAPMLSDDDIRALGGTPLNLEQDITTQAENARFILTAFSQGLHTAATEFGTRLNGKGLRALGGHPLGIASYRELRVLDLRDNDLSDLSHSGLTELQHLHTLDLRKNSLVSLESLLVSLRGCNELRRLYIRYATKTSETTELALYGQHVFNELRGLEVCDGAVNPDCVRSHPLLLSAQQVLWKVGRIGPNNLRRVDLSQLGLPASLMYGILSALHYLHVHELLAHGNEWSMDSQYSDIVILGLGPRFHWLDGVEITDQRRMLAFRADKVGKTGSRITGNLLQFENKSEQIHKQVDAWMATDAGRRAQAKLLRRAGIEEQSAPGMERQASVQRAGGAGGGGGPQGDQDLRLNVPNMQNINVNANAGPSAMSNVLSKVDIVIKYLQVYSITLVLDIDIPYPKAFEDFSTWIRLSTLNLEDLWSFDMRYQQSALFGLVMATPAVLLLLYFYFDRLRGRQAEWAKSYVTNWRWIKWRTFALYILALCCTTAISLCVIDGPNSLSLMRNGDQPSPMSVTWALVFFAFLTLWYVLWFRVVRLFQRHWNADQTAEKQVFYPKWLNLIHWAQIIILFALTSVYLPVARVILIQFACDCRQSNADSLCTSRLYASDTCFPNPVTPTQGIALVFIVLYIVLLPLFLIKLIREGIATVMELNVVYDQLGREIEELKSSTKDKKTAIKALPSPNTPDEKRAIAEKKTSLQTSIKNNDEAIKAKEKRREAEYWSRVNDPVRKLASTTLYSSYEYKWRYWKILQLAQNLLLVCISLFVPLSIGGIDQARVFLGCFAIGGSFLFVCWVRPYYDNWEDAMEICAGMANTVTVLVALGLQYKVAWLTETRSSTILLAANLAAVISFVLAIVIVPCRICSQNRALARQAKRNEANLLHARSADQKEEQKKQNAPAAASSANPKAVHQAPQKGAAAASASNGNKQAVQMAAVRK